MTLLSTLETILNPEWLAELGIYNLHTLELFFDVLNLVCVRYFDKEISHPHILEQVEKHDGEHKSIVYIGIYASKRNNTCITIRLLKHTAVWTLEVLT